MFSPQYNRFYNKTFFLDQGKICVDGIETSERPLAQLRQFIRDVSQSDAGMLNQVRDDFINESQHMDKNKLHHPHPLTTDDYETGPSVLHQDTSLLSGSLRLCLDPTGKFTDAQLWQILQLLELQGIKF